MQKIPTKFNSRTRFPTISLNIAHRPPNNPDNLSNFLSRFFLGDSDKSLGISPAGIKSRYDFEDFDKNNCSFYGTSRFKSR